VHTYQIANPVLDNFRTHKLTDERIDFLIAQANEQLEEITQNKDLYERFLKEVDAPEKLDNIVLWMLFMSNEEIVEAYIDQFGKKYREMIPVSDLADLLVYAVHLKKLKDSTLEGFDYFLDYQGEGKTEMDHYAFMNVLLYVQKTKEAPMEF
jgi:hypothetical protein